MKWYEHVVRIVGERKLRAIMEARPERKRGRGRPRFEWEEYVERLEDVEKI